MIIVRLKGGLGNQLFQYALGYALSRKFECALKVDAGFFETQGLRSFDLAKFSVPFELAEKSECIRLGAPINFRNKIIKKLGLNNILFPRYVEESATFIYEDRLASFGPPVYLDGYWQNLKYFGYLRKELINLIRPKSPLSSAFRTYLEDIRSHESVSIHVRRGDYVNDPHTRSIHYVCDLEYYLGSIRLVLNDDVNQKFYIFSDDISWCRKHFGFLENVEFVAKTESAVEDFELMRNCRTNIISNSTFSWWASWLNVNHLGHNGCVSVFPKKWSVALSLEETNLRF